MDVLPEYSVGSSIAVCRRLTRDANSSFVPAFSLLPADKKEAMYVLYAFDRFTDDLIDNSSDAQTKRQNLRQWVNTLRQFFSDTDYTEVNPEASGVILLPALKYITEKFNVPVKTYFQLTDGIESDIEPQLFASFEDSAKYCHCVATSVGIASLAIWGTAEPPDSVSAAEAAKNCGLAFQWTNILRDILDDCRSGRIYLPVDELNRFGFTPDSFAEFVIRSSKSSKDNFETQFIRLLNFQTERCETFYRQAVPLYELINKDSRNVFAMMFMRYYKLFQKIKENPLIVLKKRICLSLFEKMMLFLCGRFGLMQGFLRFSEQINR